MRKIVLVLLVVGMVLAFCHSEAYAGGAKWTFPNDTGGTAYDLHINFKNGATFDPANSTPFTYDDGTPGSSANHHLDGGSDVANGGTATVRFTTTGSPPRIKSWFWTKFDGSQLGSTHNGPPAAKINVRATDMGDGVVVISYDGAESRPRAFALDISVTAGNITTVDPCKTGESTQANKGFGIFMGTIDLSNPLVPIWNSPVAPNTDPCTAGDLGSGAVTCEMGSLYVENTNSVDSNAPGYSGDLLRLTVTTTCTLNIALNARRGGIVMEDPNQVVDANLTGTEVPLDCYTGPQPAEWAAVGEPNCWCASLQPRQCHGDADGRSQGKGNTWVLTWDLDVLVDAWNKDFPTIDGNTVLTGGGDNIPLICADFDHLSQGKGNARVLTWDLDILVAAWNLGDPDTGDPNYPWPNCP